MNVLEIENLNITFQTRQGLVQAVRSLSFSIEQGECLGVVGESGSGKSITALSIMDLLPHNANVDVKKLSFYQKEIRKQKGAIEALRGKDISMIFQDPMSSLNPCYTIGFQLMEVLKKENSKNRAREKAIELLEQVGISEPEIRLRNYPHELSGGMLQRVMIAIAIALKPKLLIADEPTTALDVTIQAQILQLLEKLRKEINMSIILISHNMGVVAENASRMLVMYAGEMLELAPTRQIIRDPRHPYTRKLLDALPGGEGCFKQKLSNIPGMVPSLKDRPSACQFHPRCEYVEARCKQENPRLSLQEERMFKCWKPLHRKE